MPGGAAAEPPRKRPAPGPGAVLDQLPYQRKASFRRRLHVSLEEEACRFVDANGAGSVSSSSSRATLAGDLPMVSVALGRVVGRGNDLDVVLPLGAEAVLDDAAAAHDFCAALPADAFAALAARLEEERTSWQRAPPTGRRWADISVVERASCAAVSPSATLTVFCPEGRFHYQLRARPAGAGAGGGDAAREVVYTFAKGAGPEDMFWTVTLLGDPAEPGAVLSAEVSLNCRLLWGQRLRMRGGQRHAFSVVVRDLLRNVRSSLAVLRSPSGGPESRCHYPGILDSSAEVRQFYSERAKAKAESAPKGGGEAPAPTGAPAGAPVAPPGVDATQKIRKYNNLVKVLQIEEFADCMPSPLRVLDLGCGRGQDVNKWAREFRSVLVKKYVGVDFADDAVAEAMRRHEVRRRQARHASCDEYPATFYSGDLRDGAVFQQMVAEGHGSFDVVSIQFVLNYLASSEACMRDLFTRVRGLLRPGGRVLASVTNSDALGDFFARGVEAAGAGPAAERGVEGGNRLFSLGFRHEVWRRLDVRDEEAFEEAFSQRWGYPYVFSLAGAVNSQEEYNVPWEAFEELVTGLGFKVLLDGRFPEIYSAYAERSRFYKGVFSNDPLSGSLSAEEAELFGLYSAFVLERA